MALVIPRSSILDPARNAPFAIAAVALSLFVFAYSTTFGQISILLLYALWLPLPFLSPAILTEASRQILLILLLPALAVLSAFWSDVTATTLRAAVKYGTTVLCGLIAAACRLAAQPCSWRSRRRAGDPCLFLGRWLPRP